MTAPLPLTISERVRRMERPTEPPRYAVFTLIDGEDAACTSRDDDPELALDLTAQKLAEAAEKRAALVSGAYGCTKVGVVDERGVGNRISIYEQRIIVLEDGSTVIPPATYVHEAKWCAACEAVGHTVVECGDEDPHAGDVEETVAESVGGCR